VCKIKKLIQRIPPHCPQTPILGEYEFRTIFMSPQDWGLGRTNLFAGAEVAELLIFEAVGDPSGEGFGDFDPDPAIVEFAGL
jgi:hypothetical protein